MAYGLLGLVLLVAFLDWLAIAKQWKRLQYLTRPGVMLLLISWLYVVDTNHEATLWFLLGLIFSLAGDVLLMLPGGYFLHGLIAFLGAQLSYVIGFNTILPVFTLPRLLLTLAMAVALFIIAWRLYWRLSKGLQEKGQSSLQIPVLAYSIVITLMVFSALLTLFRPGWELIAALLAILGACLFFASDSILAWVRFVGPISQHQLKVMITYHIGQILIAFGVALALG